MTYHRNPIVDGRIAVSLDRTVALDWLHNLSLGIFQCFIASLIATLIGLDAWKIPGTEDVRRCVSICRLQNGLFQFYAKEARSGNKHSEVQRWM